MAFLINGTAEPPVPGVVKWMPFHRPQAVPGAIAIRYAGSPIPLGE